MRRAARRRPCVGDDDGAVSSVMVTSLDGGGVSDDDADEVFWLMRGTLAGRDTCGVGDDNSCLDEDASLDRSAVGGGVDTAEEGSCVLRASFVGVACLGALLKKPSKDVCFAAPADMNPSARRNARREPKLTRDRGVEKKGGCRCGRCVTRVTRVSRARQVGACTEGVTVTQLMGRETRDAHT